MWVAKYLAYGKVLHYTSRAKSLVLGLLKVVKIIIYNISLHARYKARYYSLL